MTAPNNYVAYLYRIAIKFCEGVARTLRQRTPGSGRTWRLRGDATIQTGSGPFDFPVLPVNISFRSLWVNGLWAEVIRMLVRNDLCAIVALLSAVLVWCGG